MTPTTRNELIELLANGTSDQGEVVANKLSERWAKAFQTVDEMEAVIQAAIDLAALDDFWDSLRNASSDFVPAEYDALVEALDVLVKED